MLRRVIEWSLGHRLAVVAAWMAISLTGMWAFWELPLDAFPDTTPVQVQVNTVAPSLSPAEIERTITMPLEWSLSGLPGLTEVRSVSKFGFSQIVLTFEEGTDIYLARQMVMERLSTAALPPGVSGPSMGPVATGLGEVLHYLVVGEDSSLSELRTIHDWMIRPMLRSVPGVAEVNSWGGDELQIHVLVDPLELHRRGLSIAELATALEENNANVGGGSVDHAGESVLVHGIGIATRISDIEEMVIDAREGVPIRVRDVARVVEGRELRRGAVTADGRGEVVLGLAFMLMGENSHDVTTRLKLRLDEIRRTLPAGVRVETVYDRTWLVGEVLGTVRTNLLEGALLVIAVLFVFLGSLRAGLIVALAIPLSMLFAGNMMLRFGIAGSLMSLGAIDFGLIVDSAVIQVENAVRHLETDTGDRSRLDVIRDAILEVRRPTMFGELIIAIVYLPVLTLEGIEGKLFRPMALTVLFALAGSMLLSLTLIPALASFGLRRHRLRPPGRLARGVLAGYRAVVEVAIARPRIVLVVALLLAVNAGFLATRLGSEFVPRLREWSLVINTVRLAGVSVDESIRYGSHIEAALLEKFPDEIERVWTRTGSAEITTDPMGLEVSDVFVTLRPREDWRRASTQDELVALMAEELSALPGMKSIFTQPIEMRVNEMIAGVRSDVAVKLFGDDFEMLKAKAREIEDLLGGIEGAADLFTEQLTGQPILEVVMDREALARHGIRVAEVLATVGAISSHPAGILQEGERRFTIAVRLEERFRTDIEAVGRLLVATTHGERVPLAALADIRLTEGLATVYREWGKRRIVIQANVRGRDLGSFVADARAAIDAGLDLPPGYFVRFGGQFEHLERAQIRLLLVVPLAMLLIFVLLYFTYGNLLDSARVFTGVPLAAVGGIVALSIRDIPFSISAGVGFVALSGVAVLGDMVLVSTIRRLLAQGLSVRDAVVQATQIRLRPVLMTALVAGLGFVPMALNTGIGAEVQRPLATVVIGGVISSTLLTLVVVPALYSYLGGRRRPTVPDGDDG